MAEAVNDQHAAWQRLTLRWQESERAWNDPVRREFEKRYWQALTQENQATAKEMERLAQVLAQARRSVR
ncbi:MAG: hypothetical protein HC802_23405 [Caldilineaceae bacterium]|nr:hypothetical protein [Caldilineaceae bacterium]